MIKMDLITTLGIVAATAVAVERGVTVIKPLYLKVKNTFAKTPATECTKTEKEIITVILGPVICIVAQIGIDIPGVTENAYVQYVLAGLLASLGSNVLHALLSIILAIKNSAEEIKTPNP
jgi:hypothetical protein